MVLQKDDDSFPHHTQTLETTFGDQTFSFDVPEGVWNPTPHGIHLGNMLLKLNFQGENVLELGAGCGIHTVLIAKQGAQKITATEINQHSLENGKHNLEKYRITTPADFQIADWTHVSGGPWDTLVTNPPFAKSGKTYRRYFIDTLILDAHKLLKPGGRLIFVQSSMADIAKSTNLMKECGFQVNVVGETSGPFRDYYFEDKKFMEEIQSVPNGYTVKENVFYERLVVFEARN